MSLMSKSRVHWFVLLLIPLVMVMVYMYAVKPVREDRSAMQQELEKKQKELHTLQAKLEGGASFGGKDKVLLDQVRVSLPEAPYVEELIRDFRMLEVVSGLKMESYNILIADAVAAGTVSAGQTQPPAWSMLAKPIKMSTSVKGSYPQIYRLLSELKTSKRIIQVESINFTAPTSYPVKLNSPTKEITSTITFVAYYAPGLSRFYQQSVPTDYTNPPGRFNPIY
jgi:Tfp pilus assembly protein PilO